MKTEGYNQDAIRGEPCSKEDFIKWHIDRGEDTIFTQPLPVFDERGFIKYYKNKVYKIVDGGLICEE